MTTSPILFRWSGEAMEPLPRLKARCDREYVVGEIYPLVEQVDRSIASQNHQFAWLKDAWLSLPENLKDLYATPEHLRKRALIDAGFYHEEIIDVGTNAGALRVAAYARTRDEFAYVIVRGGFVFVRTAKSQSRRAMKAKEFQESKQALMDTIAGMLGVTAHELAGAEAA